MSEREPRAGAAAGGEQRAAAGTRVTERVCRACHDFQTWMRARRRPLAPDTSGDEGTAAGSSAPAVDTAAGGSHGDTAVRVSEAAPAPVHRRADCPVDKDELGRGSWSLLHTMAANYADEPSDTQRGDMRRFLELFAQFYPCGYCADDMKAYLREHRPTTGSQRSLSLYLCQLHNDVNARTGKAAFDCDLVQQRWRDGWHDGTCG